MITVNVNNKEYQCSNLKLSEFLKEIGFEKLENLAIAVNETIIPKKEMGEYMLRHNDRVVLITATYGG